MVLLCDVLSDTERIEHLVEAVRRSGLNELAVVGICRYSAYCAPEGVPTKSYVTFDCGRRRSGEACVFCGQGVHTIQGSCLADFARELRALEPCVFWELVASVPDGYSVGHWVSDRTGYHYQFRVLTEPIFKTYGYGLAWCVRNLLEAKGIIPDWIKAVVCPAEPEAHLLAQSIAEVLGLRKEDTFPIPRRYFTGITGRELPQELINDLAGRLDRIQGRNVIIVDQAAHKLGTYRPLSLMSAYYGCDVLAFVVFLDRVSASASLGDFLPASHYIPLYTWQSAPLLEYSCPCNPGAK